MDKAYKISRIIISLIVFIFFLILFRNEDTTWLILIPVFTIIIYLLSYPITMLSKKYISIGNNIKNNFFKFLYYILLLFIHLLLCFIVYIIYNNFFISSNLSQSLKNLIWLIIIWTGIIVMYLETIIIILVKKIIKK